MMKRLSVFSGFFQVRPEWVFLLFALWLWGCANPISPRGGPRDETPPRVVTEKSTPNLSTNFQEKRIVLTFDEWVKLNDAFNQVIISPPLQEAPEIRLNRKKGVVFEFKEELRPNTTYTINFGDAVQDITESNEAENLRFVFSTGSYIDSLEVKGNVTNSKTGKTEADVLFMLYENAYDSIVYREKPLYFAKTDKSGAFKIENVKPGSFKVFVLRDNNYNYLYDLANEQVGFLEEEITINDSTVNQVTVAMFEAETPLQVQQRDLRTYGKIQVLFNRSPGPISVEMDRADIPYFVDRYENDLIVWYHSSDTGRFDLFVDWGQLDTMTVFPAGREKLLQTEPRVEVIDEPVRGVSGNAGSNKRPSTRSSGRNNTSSNAENSRTIAPMRSRIIHPDDTLDVHFNWPLESVDTSLVYLLEDTLGIPLPPRAIALGDSPNLMKVIHSWKEGLDYELVFPAGSLTNIFGFGNDTLSVPVRTQQRKDFGNIINTIEQLDSTRAYIIELTDSKEKLLDRYTVRNVKTSGKTYGPLTPGSYLLRIIIDENANGRWDTGSYEEKRQPEEIILNTLPPLRANWDVDAKVILEESQ